MLAKRKILIVENDIFQFTAIASFLTAKGFCVLRHEEDEPVASYDEALKAIEPELPDIAILDIEINGKKDGIELAEYLQPLNIPVIFLTANDNAQNLERAKQLLPKGFITKTEKPYDERNLWNAVTMAMEYVEERKKHLSKGISLKVKEVDLPIIPKAKSEDEDIERQKIEMVFDWANITYFYSGPKAPHNYVILRMDYSSKKGFLYKASLNYFENILPSYFVRINANLLINAQKITQHYLPGKVFIEKEEFEITKSYSKAAEQKIKMILGI
jgi:two-component system, LytTR family, response regulator LytT